MASALDRLFLELQRFVEPLGVALNSPGQLAAFLRGFGFAFDGADVAGAAGQLAPMRAAVLKLVATTRAAVADGLDAGNLADIAVAAQPVFQGLDSLPDAVSALAPPGGLSPAEFARSVERFPEELFNVLLTDYLADNAPLVLHALVALDVVGTTHIPETGDPRSRGIAYTVPESRWDRLRLLVDDASRWAEQAYGWGVAFDSDTFIFRFVRIFQYLGGVAEIREMSEGQATVLMPHLATSPAKPTFALAPIIRTKSIEVSDAGEFVAMNEIGLALLPVAGRADPSDAGIAIAPYTEGTIAQKFQLRESTELELTGAIGAVGGVVFSFRPSGASYDVGLDGVAFSGTRFGLVLRYAPAAIAILAGRPLGTRLQLAGAEAGLTFDVIDSARVEAVATLETKGLSLVIAPSDADAFVGSALGGKENEIPIPFSIRWSSRTGLGLQGGRIAATVSPNISIGPIRVETVSIALYGEQPQGGAARAVLEAGAGLSGSLGPVAFAIEGVGLQATVAYEDGNLGPLDVSQHFKPPTGVGLAIDAGVVRGGGFLAFDASRQEYSGVLQLEIADTIAVQAIGLLTTRLPDGGRGFSLVILIAAEGFPPIQLGFGFTLTGVGGLLGVHRTTQVEVLRSGLRTGTLGSILFPADPIRHAPQIVSDLRAVFPPARGRYVFGPMARIAWGTPTLLTVDLALLLELPEPVRLIVLARLQAVLPDARQALIQIRMDAVGVIDFTQGEVALDATLFESRILAFVLTGGMALRARWGRQATFVLAVGGFNPRFQPPAGFPAVARLALSLGDGDNPRLRLACYLALTSNTVQFGARFDFAYTAAGFTLAGFLGFDALFQFTPFAFVADVGAMVALKRGRSVLMGVFLDLTLSGPTPWRIRGTATFKVLFFSVTIRFDHRFGREAPAALPPPVDVLGQLVTALEDRRNWTSAVPAGVHARVAVRAAAGPGPARVHPLAALSVRQRVVPLNRPVTKLGTVPLGAPTTFTVTAAGPQAPLPLAGTVLRDAFALAQYEEMRDDEKLVRPAFETQDAGLAFGAGAVAYPDEGVPATALTYETLLIDPTRPPDAAPVTPPYVLPAAVLEAVVSLGAAGQAPFRRRAPGRPRAFGSAA